MATTTAPRPSVLHPRADAFTLEAQTTERRLGLLFAVSGITVVALMGVLGLLMRLTQAEALGISQAWFYRMMTLHGGGMIVGVLLVMMGALWYVLRSTVPLRTGWMLWSYGLIMAGIVVTIVATLAGGFAAGWTFLPPLPFFAVGQWPVWSESLFFVGMLLAGGGFFVYCLDVFEQTTTTYGGVTRTLGWRYLRGRETDAPPPQVIAGTVVAIDGLLSMAAGMAIVVGLLGHTYDGGVAFDALVSKNLVYLFGHSMANLVIYLAAGAVYVLIPRYAGRPYATNKVFVAGWAASLVFIATAYSHHLYMDFVQPVWAQAISQLASYFALIPVAVITIYSMTMLVWGSRYRWTLASSLLYVGLGGWAIGGVGAVIDSLIPINFRLHNTVWVVAHFHTYLMLTVVLWALAFLVHLLERDAGETSSRAARFWTIGLLLVGGYGLTGAWFVEGALGVPRRYATQPDGTAGYSLVGSIFGIVFALGVGLCLVQLVPLARTAWRRRHYVAVERVDSWTGGRYEGRESRVAVEPAAVDGHRSSRRGAPLATAGQLGFAVAVAVVALVAFFPQVVDASETSIRYHHLDHAGQFLLGTLLGLLLGSLRAVSRRLGDRPGIGLAVAILAPLAMMLLMVPRLYEPLEAHSLQHALYHLAMAAFGLVTGLGASRLTPLGGRFTALLSVAMVLMFAAAMTGGG
jgi:cytochrome c oxidase subunit I